jgi:hypothetical protein
MLYAVHCHMLFNALMEKLHSAFVLRARLAMHAAQRPVLTLGGRQLCACTSPAIVM